MLPLSGQERAKEALSFGLGIEAKGYNLYVMGEHATGRYTLVHEYISKNVGSVPTPDDWCFINNLKKSANLLCFACRQVRVKSCTKNSTV